MLALAQRGAYTLTAQTVYPSWTLPGHASMLTGLEPIGHGIDFDEYRDTFVLKSPTVLALVHAAGKRSVMVVGKDKFQAAQRGRRTTATCARLRGDDDVANEAIVQAASGFDFLFVHLPQVDMVGHASGWMSPEYLAQLQQDRRGRLAAASPACRRGRRSSSPRTTAASSSRTARSRSST